MLRGDLGKWLVSLVKGAAEAQIPEHVSGHIDVVRPGSMALN